MQRSLVYINFERCILQRIYSEIGKLAQNYWMEIPNHFPYVGLGDFIIMPNHIHGILIIDKNTEISDAINRVSTTAPLTLPTNKTGGFARNKNPMNNNNISRIIRWYKGRCSFEMRKIHADFAWQSGFYDHIIRTNNSHQTISDYISINPIKWRNDKFYNK